MHRCWRVGAALAVAGAALLPVACTVGDEDTPAPGSSFPEQDAEIVDPMHHERSAGWEDYEILSETQLRFLSMSGNQACYGQRYQLEEGEEEVAVAIIVGTRPDGAEVCTQELVAVAVPVIPWMSLWGTAALWSLSVRSSMTRSAARGEVSLGIQRTGCELGLSAVCGSRCW